jgi:hypothetical protein
MAVGSRLASTVRLVRHARVAPVRLALVCLAAATLGACDNQLPSDPTLDAGVPSTLGSGNRVSQVMNPSLPTHPASGATVSISGATFLTVDTFDETHDGKSKGTVYLQDVPSPTPQPYSGTSLYSPTYTPANLEPAPGDILDLTGVFTVDTSIGAAVFSAGTALVQIDKPVVKARFEYELPAPLVINASDLDSAFATGAQWGSMLVTIQNVTFPDNVVDSNGRDTIHITSDVSQDAPTLANELFDVAAWNEAQPSPPLAAGKTVKSITGIVTWFFNFHICPRSPADIVVQ